MAEIRLSQHKVAIVDDQDYPLLSDFHWCYRAERNGKQGYAVRHVRRDGKDRLAYLHRDIMQPPPDHEVVFLNHDRLDCRRENLKVVTKKEAKCYHRVRKDSTSGIIGVRFHPSSGRHFAYITRNHKQYHLGSFATEQEAVDARRRAQNSFDGTCDETRENLSAPPQVDPIVTELVKNIDNS